MVCPYCSSTTQHIKHVFFAYVRTYVRTSRVSSLQDPRPSTVGTAACVSRCMKLNGLGIRLLDRTTLARSGLRPLLPRGGEYLASSPCAAAAAPPGIAAAVSSVCATRLYGVLRIDSRSSRRMGSAVRRVSGYVYTLAIVRLSDGGKTKKKKKTAFVFAECVCSIVPKPALRRMVTCCYTVIHRRKVFDKCN